MGGRGGSGGGGVSEGVGDGVVMVPVDQLDKLSVRYGDPNESPYFANDKTVNALVKDMKKNGIKLPVTVETDGKLGLLQDGNHRVAAAKLAGIKSIPTRFTSASTRYLSRGGGAQMHSSVQSYLAKNPGSVRADVPRQNSWTQGER